MRSSARFTLDAYTGFRKPAPDDIAALVALGIAPILGGADPPLETRDIPDVEILSTGTKHGGGCPAEGCIFTEADLDEIVTTYIATRALMQPPVKLGHTADQALVQADGMPNAGLMTNVRRVGNKLMADLVKVPKKVADLIGVGAYPWRSVELMPNFPIGGVNYKLALVGLALLGADLPADQTLAEIHALYQSLQLSIDPKAQIVMVDTTPKLVTPIPTHTTEVTLSAWDGPGNELRLTNPAQFRRAFAFTRAGDQNDKDSYLFPHHEVDTGGMVKAANLAACEAQIAILNGETSGMPATEKQAAWNHLARHMRDGALEPVELLATKRFALPAGVSYDDFSQRVRNAIVARYPAGDNGPWIRDLYDDTVIFCDGDGDDWQASYTVSKDGAVSLADNVYPVQRKTEWQRLARAANATALLEHPTATEDGAWDVTATMQRLRADAPATYYQTAFAYLDPDGDPKQAIAYDALHHEVSASGAVGGANLRACAGVIAALNSGRAGVPDAERQAVYDHAAQHLTAGGREPAALLARNMPYVDQVERVLADVTALVERSEALVALRAQDGRTLSEDHLERLALLLAGIDDARTQVRDLLARQKPKQNQYGRLMFAQLALARQQAASLAE